MAHTRVKLSGLLATFLVVSSACGPERAQRPAHVEQPQPTLAFDGSVIGVDGQTPDRALARNVRVRMQPEKGDPVDVDLAPGWYLDEHGLRFAPEERIEVEGIQTRQSGQSVIVARKVRRGPVSVVLRDAEGNPTWTEPKPAE